MQLRLITLTLVLRQTLQAVTPSRDVGASATSLATDLDLLAS